MTYRDGTDGLARGRNLRSCSGFANCRVVLRTADKIQLWQNGKAGMGVPPHLSPASIKSLMEALKSSAAMRSSMFRCIR